MLILFSSFLYVNCYNHIGSSIPNIPIDFLPLQSQFSLVLTSFLPLPGLHTKRKWNQDPYLLLIILSTLFYTSRVCTSNMHLNTWGFAFLQFSISCLYGWIILPSLFYPTHHRMPFSFHFSFQTPPPSP